MALLRLLSFVASFLGFAFSALCLASGLLYLAELIEENSQTAKRFGKHLVHLVLFLHLAFYLFDSLPLSLILLGTLSHLVYLSNFSHKAWPSLPLSSPSFLATCTIVLVDHLAWFFYFVQRLRNQNLHPSYHRFPHSTLSSGHPWDRFPNHLPDDQLGSMDIVAFFAVCVWLVPFFIFLSLSASDGVLPNSFPDPTISMPTLAAQPPTPTKNFLAGGYDARMSYSSPSALVMDLHSPSLPAHPSFFKSILQVGLGLLPRLSARNSSGRTSSRPNEGLISPSRPGSPSFKMNNSLGTDTLLPSPSPPGTPIITAHASSSFSPSSVTTSPRRAFSNNYALDPPFPLHRHHSQPLGRSDHLSPTFPHFHRAPSPSLSPPQTPVF